MAVYLTGEPAEELVESLPTFDHDMVERHEAVALWAAGRGGRLAATATRLVLE